MSCQKKTPMPKWIFLQLLEACNLRCRMCYEWGEIGSYHDKDTLQELDLKTTLKIIDECKADRPHYDIFGGEPLLYPHLESVIKAMKLAGSNVDMPTNGVLLEEKAEMLIDCGLDNLWISLDGPRQVNDWQRGTGVYDRVIKGIQKLSKLKKEKNSIYPKIGIGTVVTPDNFGFLSQLFLEELDLSQIDSISIDLQSYITETNYQDYHQFLYETFDISNAPIAKGFIADETSFSKINYEQTAIQIKLIAEKCREYHIYLDCNPKDMSSDSIEKYFTGRWDEITGIRKRCPYPWINAEITARGDVTTCHSFYDVTFGNVYENSFTDVWNSEKYQKFRKHMKRNLLPICPACCLFYNTNRQMRAEYTADAK